MGERLRSHSDGNPLKDVYLLASKFKIHLSKKWMKCRFFPQWVEDLVYTGPGEPTVSLATTEGGSSTSAILAIRAPGDWSGAW
jgi:hypothetical protein